MEGADDEPEELVTGAEAGPTLATEGDLELLAQEQVLDEETLVAAEGAGEGGEEERARGWGPGLDVGAGRGHGGGEEHGLALVAEPSAEPATDGLELGHRPGQPSPAAVTGTSSRLTYSHLVAAAGN